jgi:5-methylcytosine-specific restriction protein A
MPFEDIGTTKRLAMPQMRILKIWEAGGGVCCLCNRPIDGTRDRWFIEHILALELGGKDTDDNCAPAHYECKPAKDADDHSRAAEAKREKAAQLGIPKRSTLKSPGFAKSARQNPTRRPVKWFGDAFPTRN